MGRRRPPRRGVGRAEDLDVTQVLAITCGGPELESLRDLWPTVRAQFMPSPTCPDGGTHAEPFRCRPGTRPIAWWHFERGEDPPRPEGREVAYLEQLHILEPWEAPIAYGRFRDVVLRHQRMPGGAPALAEWLGLDVDLVMSWLLRAIC